MAKVFVFKILVAIIFLFSYEAFTSENAKPNLSLSDYLEMKKVLKEWGFLRRKNLESVSKESYKKFKLDFENFKKDFSKEVSEFDVVKKKVHMKELL